MTSKPNNGSAPHEMDVQMRFTDVDMFGHVNNTILLQYMDMAKSEYITQVLGADFDLRRHALVIVNINVDYFQPARPGEQLRVLSRIKHVAEHSLTFEQQVVSAKAPDEPKCTARTVMVAIDIAKTEKMAIPDTWRAAISLHEGKTM